MRLSSLFILLLCALPAFGQDLSQDFRPLPLHEAADIIGRRYHGRLLAARLAAPTPHERSLGVELVEELRLLTPGDNLLLIRLNARNGQFLDIMGTGQIEALKR